MSAMLLVELAAKSALVAGGALILLARLNRRSAAERSWVAHAALVVLAALPAAVLFLPRWRLLAPRESVVGAGFSAPQAAPPAAAMVDPGAVVQALYLGGAALLLVGTLFAVARLFALSRNAAVLVDAHWVTALARAQARMNVKSGAALLVSDALTSPVSWGLMRPTIVVNKGIVAQSGDAEAIIAHELAHVARLDWAKLLIARAVTAVFWFNPLVWILASQCHQLREEAADDAVLGAEVSSADYAALLVEAARHECRAGLIAAHGVAPGKGSLHRRVTRVLDAAARRGPAPAAWAGSVLLGAVLFAGPLAALTLERAEGSPAAETVTISSAPAPARAPTVSNVRATAAKSASPVARAANVRVEGKAAPTAVTVTGAASRKGRPTRTVTLAEPMGQDKPRLTLTRVMTAAPRTPKIAAAATPPREPGAPKVGVTVTADPETVTVGDKSGASSSSSSSHSITTNGRTVNIEARGGEAGTTGSRATAADRARTLRAEERARAHAAADLARTAKAEQRDRDNTAAAQERAAKAAALTP